MYVHPILSPLKRGFSALNWGFTVICQNLLQWRIKTHQFFSMMKTKFWLQYSLRIDKMPEVSKRLIILKLFLYYAISDMLRKKTELVITKADFAWLTRCNQNRTLVPLLPLKKSDFRQPVNSENFLFCFVLRDVLTECLFCQATPHLMSKRKSLHGRKLRPKSVVDSVEGLSSADVPDLLPSLSKSSESDSKWPFISFAYFVAAQLVTKQAHR